MFVKLFHVSAAGGQPWQHATGAAAACNVRVLGVRAQTGVTRHAPQQHSRCVIPDVIQIPDEPPRSSAAAAGMLLREIMARVFSRDAPQLDVNRQHGTAFLCW